MYSLYEQYKKAYPEIHYDKPEDKAHTYGWRGAGIGWQKDPSEWKTDNVYPAVEDPTADDDATDGGDAEGEMIMKAETIEGVGSYGSFFDTYMLGERGSGLYSSGDVQDFYKLRDYHYDNGSLFEDPQFPANRHSLSYSGKTDYGVVEWLRPSEICDSPKLFVEGFSRFDVQQGALGDCWFLAAVANITLYHNLFFQVVPIDQDFEEKYAGIFHFRFWQYGRWIDVVIDDKLPTQYGQLVFLSSTEKNEFWSALLEKAYAKLHGSYEALEGGNTCEAMEDFTGGVSEIYFSEEAPPNLFKIMKKAFERGSLICAAIEPDPNVKEAKTREGLVKGHAYSMTRVLHVDISTPRVSGKMSLVRIRNPWGNEMEWNGPWSDGSPEWGLLPDYEKERIGLNFDNDGEFWMSFQDMLKYFNRIEICNLNPDSLEDGIVSKKWELSMFEGSWVKGATAGGCRNYLDTFVCNPQYNITLEDPDDDDGEKCTVIVSLMQKNRRKQRNMGHDHLTIGFVFYYIPDPDNAPKPLDKYFFKHNAMVGKSPVFVNLREVSCRFTIPPGTYCIIPSTFEPDDEGEFLIRVFSENKNNLVYVSNGEDDEVPTYRPPPPPPPRFSRPTQDDYRHGGFDVPSFPFSFFNSRFNFLFNSANDQRNSQPSSSVPNQPQQAPYGQNQQQQGVQTPYPVSYAPAPYPGPPAYPQQQPYQPAYPTHQAPYPSQYPSQQSPYPSQQPPYPSQQPPYPSQQPPYPMQQPPYPMQQPPYPIQQPHHQNQNYSSYNSRPPYPPGNYPGYPPY